MHEYMHVCMHVCIVCVYTCVHASMCICMYVYMYVCVILKLGFERYGGNCPSWEGELSGGIVQGGKCPGRIVQGGNVRAPNELVPAISFYGRCRNLEFTITMLECGCVVS